MKHLLSFALYESNSFSDIVFHGSDEMFENFSIDESHGVFFASDVDYAKEYGNVVYKCVVQLKNPRIYSQLESENDMEIDRMILIDKGYDGRIVMYDNGECDVVAFYEHQIKILEIMTLL
jgi:hypothetical protein